MALVRAHGQDGPAGPVVFRVGGGVAILVDDPTLRHRLPPVAGQGDLTGRHGTGGHVQQHRALQVAGNADADGVGPQPTGPSAEGRHRLGAGPGIRGDHRDHSFLYRHSGVVAQTPDVALVMNGDGGHSVHLGFLNGHAHGLFGDHEPEPPVTVDHGGAGSLLFHDEGSAGNDMPLVDTLHVLGDMDDAMRVVAHQISLDLVGGHHLGLLVGNSLGPIDVIGHLVQIFGREHRHGGYLLAGCGRGYDYSPQRTQRARSYFFMFPSPMRLFGWLIG